MEINDKRIRGIERMEQRLRDEARRFLRSMHEARMKPHNAESILVRLTGKCFDNLAKISQIRIARTEVKAALMRERKKARTKHRDYDINRHIALHQANKSLDEMLLCGGH